MPGYEIVGNVDAVGTEVEELHEGDRVGVGWQGHLAIQFARAPGCRVTAISSSPDKKTEVFEFGANEFFSIQGDPRLRQGLGNVDLLELVVKQLSVTGSLIGSRAAMRKMLSFPVCECI